MLAHSLRLSGPAPLLAAHCSLLASAPNRRWVLYPGIVAKATYSTLLSMQFR